VVVGVIFAEMHVGFDEMSRIEGDRRGNREGGIGKEREGKGSSDELKINSRGEWNGSVNW